MQFMSINLVFENNSGVTDQDVYIGFCDPFINATYKGGTINPMQTGSGTFYSLADLKDIIINSTSGRVYVCYNATIGNTEPAQAPTDPYFFQRYDKFEITVLMNGSTYVDMTSIDYWSIPMSLYASLDGNQVAQSLGLLNNSTAQELYNSLLQLTSPPVSGLTQPGGVDGLPIPALVPGSFQQFGKNGPKPPVPPFFCRIMGPSSYATITPPGIPVLPYDTMANYLDWLLTTYGPGTTNGTPVANLGSGTIAIIAGNFAGSQAGSGKQYDPQTYNLSALISGKNRNEQIELRGNGSVVGNFSMTYAYSDLINPSGIYGANAPYSINPPPINPPGNDLYGWVAGDFLSGLNFGIIGSNVTVPVVSEYPVGSIQSSDWWTIPVPELFSNLQPPHTPPTPFQNYNQYAAILSQYSQAYNSPYTDRLVPNNTLISLAPNNADTLTIVLEPATIVLAPAKI
jgi:hypothetical protein